MEDRTEKIRKLLAKAERAGTPEEADAFFAKAQELMTKWAVDEAMLRASGRSSDELKSEHLTIKRSGYFNSMVRLITVVAMANNVKLLVYKGASWGPHAGVDLIGFASDIEKTKMLYTSLLIQCTRERGRGLPEDIRDLGPKYVARWRHSFAFAYANRIGDRLEEMRRATESEAVAADSTGSLLPALLDRKTAVNRFYDDIPKSVGRASRISLDYRGASAGREAANRADLGSTRVGARNQALER